MDGDYSHCEETGSGNHRLLQRWIYVCCNYLIGGCAASTGSGNCENTNISRFRLSRISYRCCSQADGRDPELSYPGSGKGAVVGEERVRWVGAEGGFRERGGYS